MRASRARRISLSAIISLVLMAGTASALAAPALPLPDTMAAVGDSITQAASARHSGAHR